MRKFILSITVLSFLFFACSVDNNTNSSENIVEDNFNYSESAKSFSICGVGYHLEWELLETPIRLFKKSGCESGFGLCFSVGAVWSFDCVRNPIISAARVSFNPDNNEIKSVAVGDESTKLIKFYFHKDIVDSTDNVPSDFDVFDVENGVFISDDFELVSGVYNKNIEGEYFTYTVPFIYKK
jgi:hypothetical protein